MTALVRRVDALAVLAATIYAIVQVRLAPSWTVDDTWIVARYAEHLAHDGTISWNPGGAPVEGFTSLLAVLVAAAAVRLDVAPVAALDALGILGFVVTPALIGLLGRALETPPAGTALVVVTRSLKDSPASRYPRALRATRLPSLLTMARLTATSSPSTTTLHPGAGPRSRFRAMPTRSAFRRSTSPTAERPSRC